MRTHFFIVTDAKGKLVNADQTDLGGYEIQRATECLNAGDTLTLFERERFTKYEQEQIALARESAEEAAAEAAAATENLEVAED